MEPSGITSRSTAASINRWLAENPGVLSHRVLGHPKIDADGTGELADRLIRWYPDQRITRVRLRSSYFPYHLTGCMILLHPDSVHAGHLDPSTRTRLVRVLNRMVTAVLDDAVRKPDMPASTEIAYRRIGAAAGDHALWSVHDLKPTVMSRLITVAAVR